MFAPAVPEADGVKSTPQLAVADAAARRAQLVELKTPATPLVNVNVIDPVGVVGLTWEASVTVAVQVDA